MNIWSESVLKQIEVFVLRLSFFVSPNSNTKLFSALYIPFEPFLYLTTSQQQDRAHDPSQSVFAVHKNRKEKEKRERRHKKSTQPSASDSFGISKAPAFLILCVPLLHPDRKGERKE